MRRHILYILLLIPIVVWAATTTIFSPGSWDDPGIWLGGEIADNITENVDILNNTGVVTILSPDNYTIGDLQIQNLNTLTIDAGAVLNIGSISENHNLDAGNSIALNIDGTLEIWGFLDIENGIATIVTSGTLIVHGDLILGNNIVVEIQGDVTIDGDFNGGNNTDVNVDGTLTILGNVDLGTDSDLTGSGTVNISGGCTGPISFCGSGPLDVTAPVITNCPATDIDVSVAATDCDAVVNWVAPKADDGASGTVASFTSTHTPGDTFPIGITAVTYTAIDLAGNTSTCVFNVTVSDDIDPVISNCPNNIIVNLSSAACNEIINWVAPVATDNCGIASFTSSHNSGDTFPIGVTTVTYTATDPAGKVVFCNFTVTVNDITPPVFSSCTTSITIAPFDVASQTAVVTWQEPKITDDCSVIAMSSTFSSGDAFPPGLTTVVYSATDGSGNSATCEFDVDVIGNKAPIGSPAVVDVFSGQPIEICLDVRDEDGDALIITQIDDSTLNGVIERPGSVANLCFVYTSFDDFVGEEVIVFTVCDNGTPVACTKVEVSIRVTLDLRITIYKAFTPDGDNINDFWVIENIQNYPNNQVMVYDRLGGLIFSARAYNNENIVWDGRSNQHGQNILPSGTYFYKIDLGSEIPIQKGFIELVN